MKLSLLLLSSVAFAGVNAYAAEPAPLTVKVGGFLDTRPIPERFAYCVPDGKGKTKDGMNMNPAIEWSGAPENTRSFAIIIVDKDVPQTFESANQEGKEIQETFPRQDFYHWVLVDIPSSMIGIAEGKDSKEVTKTGKPLGQTSYGVNGQNDYARMSDGTHGGYDGPCPPWNDGRIHHYHFIVYALDVPTLALSGAFGGKYAEEMMKGHILAKGQMVGTFTNNKRLAP